jgi:hypothetical protein
MGEKEKKNKRAPKRVPIVTSLVTYIPLTQGLFAMIDTEDLDKVKDYTWQVSYKYGIPYAQTVIPGVNKRIYLHRLIMGAGKDSKLDIDHKNRFSLDCRKQNLRFCTHSENCRNCPPRSHSSRFKGVTRRKRKGRYVWQAQITINFKSIHIGYFESEISAALAYDQKAREIDPLAYMNFPNIFLVCDSLANNLSVNKTGGTTGSVCR